MTYTTVTDADGKAVGRGFKPNNITGEHKIEVTAAAGAMVATVVIHRKNVSEEVIGKGPGKGLLHVLRSPNAWAVAVVASGASALGYFAKQSGDESVSALNIATPANPTVPATVPEIDPSLAFGGLILLAGSIAIFRGR